MSALSSVVMRPRRIGGDPTKKPIFVGPGVYRVLAIGGGGGGAGGAGDYRLFVNSSSGGAGSSGTVVTVDVSSRLADIFTRSGAGGAGGAYSNKADGYVSGKASTFMSIFVDGRFVRSVPAAAGGARRIAATVNKRANPPGCWEGRASFSGNRLWTLSPVRNSNYNNRSRGCGGTGGSRLNDGVSTYNLKGSDGISGSILFKLLIG